MSYIQNKLYEFDKLFDELNNYEIWNDEIPGDKPITLNSFLEQALTDYHNHIVEKIEDWFENKGTNMSLDILLSLLQDTNPKEL